MAHACKVYIAIAVILCMLCVPTEIEAMQSSQDLQQISLDFSVHEIQEGSNATLLRVAGSGGMGTMAVFDNKVCEGANPDSKLLGRATGLGTTTTMDGMSGGLQIQSQITFGGDSPYNGSSITFMGTVMTPVSPWEVMALGGTGYFRGFQGYASIESGVAFPPTNTYKWSVRGKI